MSSQPKPSAKKTARPHETAVVKVNERRFRDEDSACCFQPGVFTIFLRLPIGMNGPNQMLVRSSTTGQEIIDYAGDFKIPTGEAYLVSSGKVIAPSNTLLSTEVGADARIDVLFRLQGGTRTSPRTKSAPKPVKRPSKPKQRSKDKSKTRDPKPFNPHDLHEPMVILSKKLLEPRRNSTAARDSCSFKRSTSSSP